MLEKLTKNQTSVAIIIAALIVGAALVSAAWLYTDKVGLEKDGPAAVVQPEIPGEEPKDEEKNPEEKMSLENFAKCLTEKGSKLYGASWCGWCQQQKELFGEAVQFLPYIECIDSETQQMTLECQAVGIEGFPTWVFGGEKNTGFKPLEQLAELSGCPYKP